MTVNPPVLDYPCGRARDPRPVLGSENPGHSLGGCVCPLDAYVGQRDCTETTDLHQDADGIEVLGGERWHRIPSHDLPTYNSGPVNAHRDSHELVISHLTPFD